MHNHMQIAGRLFPIQSYRKPTWADLDGEILLGHQAATERPKLSIIYLKNVIIFVFYV